jgi:hypothetical protein
LSHCASCKRLRLRTSGFAFFDKARCVPYSTHGPKKLARDRSSYERSSTRQPRERLVSGRWRKGCDGANLPTSPLSHVAEAPSGLGGSPRARRRWRCTFIAAPIWWRRFEQSFRENLSTMAIVP